MIITRYLTREVFNALFAVTTVLLLAFICQQTVRYLNYMAVGKVPTGVLLQLVSFEIPYLLAILLPLGLYLGIMLAYGRMYADNEMSILQMCGFDHWRLLQVTTYLASAVTAVVLFLMLWVNPFISKQQQQLMASDEATVHLVQTLIPGRFQASPDGRHVMYVEQLSSDRQRAETVFMAQEKKSPDHPNQSAWMLVLANQGYQTKEKGSSDPFFVTTDGYRYEGTPGQNDYKIIQFKRYAVRMIQTDAHNNHKEDETLSTSQLWRESDNPKRAAELQWRFSMGITTLILAFLAVPFSTVKPRKGRYVMLLPAVIIYIIYIELLYMARHWLEQGAVPVTIGMWWVHGLMLVFMSLVLMSGSKGWFQRRNILQGK